MLPEIGQLALVLALLLGCVQATLPLAGAARGDARWMALARPAAYGQAVFVSLAFGCLAASFLANDFSVAYVANNSNSRLPPVYRFAATWGSHEGSLLLWLLLLSGWTAAVARFSRRLGEEAAARVLAVLGAIAAAFALFLLATSNPFERLYPAAAEGRDLNPLLQDPAMAAHPPLLYVGYAGFSVAFAFAVAALIRGRYDREWARASRPWTTLAWAFLTTGIAVGSWWAYYELGWGGWWFWDPVENASLMPWLTGTALVHSLAVSDRRGTLNAWTVLLAIVAFSLSLLGTFLVRSGVLSSVHAFASDPLRGVFILAFLVLAVGTSLALFAARAPRIASGAGFGPVSRESLLLANNVLLGVAMATVFLGTLYPLALDALGLGRLSIGPPYFEAVVVPILAPVLLLAGIGPLARWREASVAELARTLRLPFAIALVAAIGIPVALGEPTLLKGVGYFLGTWILAATFAGVVQRVRARGDDAKASERLRRRPEDAGTGESSRRSSGSASITGRAWFGMVIAHLGLGVAVLGITTVKGYELERDVRLAAGQAAEAGGYTFRLERVDPAEGPNYRADRATLHVERGGRAVATLQPEKRRYFAQPTPMTEAAIDRNVLRDVYVSLGTPGDDGAWSLRLRVKPLVGWIWAGLLAMAAGGALAITDRRYRRRRGAAADSYATTFN